MHIKEYISDLEYNTSLSPSETNAMIYPTLAYFIKNKQNEHPITMESFEEYIINMDSKQWFALIHLKCTPSLPRTLYVWSMIFN